MPRIKIRDFRRNELIDAAIASIAHHGLSDTTLATIAEQAGVSPALVSHYFDGKEELLAATLLRLTKDLATDIKRRTPREATARQRLAAIIDGCLESEPLRPGAILAWRAFWAHLPYHPYLASLQKMVNSRFRSNIRLALAELLPSSRVNDGYLGLYAMIDGFWIRQFVDPESFVMADARRLCHDYLDLMIARGRQSTSPDTAATTSLSDKITQ